MVLPNFIIAGAPKAATSTLYEYIKQHPNIYMSPVKEPFFFDFNYEKGTKYYESFFKGYRGEKAIGEATVWYMSWDGVPQRMHNCVPDVKLIFVLRDPVERAFSNYLMDLCSGHYVPKQTFGYIIRNEGKINGIHRRIVSGGFYCRYIKRFEQYFGREKMLFILYDDLKKNIQNVEKTIYEFLGIDDSFRADKPGDKMVSQCLLNEEFLVEISNRSPEFNYLWAKSRHFRQFFLGSPSKSNQMHVLDRKYLFEIYSEENKKLEDYLDIDLSAWRCAS
jgi:hypothetical protein